MFNFVSYENRSLSFWKSEMTEFRIKKFAAVARRVPVAVPVRTSFGTMRDRPAVFLRITDDSGMHGYGEVWCNFPVVAAEHRVRLALDVVGPLLIETELPHDLAVFEWLMERLHVLALQSGEWGPLRQVCAGFDAAIHDLAARRAGMPLHRFLNAAAAPRIGAYASGIGPETPAATARSATAAGHVAFKVKVGFGRETDLASLAAMRGEIGPSRRLMADANQGWTLDEALRRGMEYATFDLDWLEEPLPADRPHGEWRALADGLPMPLAGGENINRKIRFDAVLAARLFGFVQPDVAKWGGVSGCMAVARDALRHHVSYCPHFLGGGVGLITSAHLLAAQGGDGMLEMDVNPNPLRDEMTADLLDVEDGRITISDRPGIGIAPDHVFDQGAS